MDPIHEILQAIDQEEGRCVLATIVQVEGSAYRKEGTTMLIREDGRRVGILTAGCLENDLASRAEDLFGGGAPQLLVYDMRTEDEEAWGQGAGCNGVIRILLETVDANMRKHLGALKKYLDSGIAVTVVKVVEGAFAGDYMYVAEGEEGERLFGEWRGGAREPLLRIARECGESEIRAAAGWYAHRFRPKPRLFLFGAGPDARPLCALAARTGFFVAVSDWRPAYCAREHFPEADELWLGFPHEIVPRLSFRPNDCVVIMTHDFQKDRELLGYLKTMRLQYLGVLGSKFRTSRLFGGEPVPDWVVSPAGIPIGAQGPEEIAVSIVGDLIRHLREGDM